MHLYRDATVIPGCSWVNKLRKISSTLDDTGLRLNKYFLIHMKMLSRMVSPWPHRFFSVSLSFQVLFDAPVTLKEMASERAQRRAARDEGMRQWLEAEKAKEKDADCKTEMAALADCLKGDKPADQCSELKTRLDSCRSKTPGKAKA